MPSVNDIIVKLRVDDKDVDVTLDDFAKQLKKVEDKGTSSGKSIGDMFSSIKASYVAVSAAVAGVAAGISKAIERASAFQESNSKLLAVYDQMPDAARKVRDELHDMYFMSYNDATALLGATGDVLQGMQMQQDASLDLAAATVKLAADRASFTNAEGGAEAIAKALTSAYVGEREALKTYGIVITEADVQQGLFAKGQDKLSGAALKAAKAQVTYELALKQSSKSVGDLQRTQDSYANTQRRLSAAVDDISVKFGAVFLPIATKVLEWGASLVNMIDVGAVAGTFLAVYEVIKNFAVRVFDVLQGIGKMIVGALTFNLDYIEEGWTQAADGITAKWGDLAVDIGTAFAEGERMVSEFMQGTAAASTTTKNQLNADQEEITKKQQEELKKREEANKARLEQFWQDEKDFREKVRNESYQQNQNILADEEAKIDRMYELNEISYADYKTILDDRIEYARQMYGQDSQEYYEAVKNKKEVDNDFYSYQQKKMDAARPMLQKFFVDVFKDGKDGIKSFGKAFIQMLTDIAAKLLAEKIIWAFFDESSSGAGKSGGGGGGSDWLATGLSIAAMALFDKGGFTTPGVSNEIAGLVHKNEYVAPEKQLQKYPTLFKALEADRRGISPIDINMPTQNYSMDMDVIDQRIGRIEKAISGLKLSAKIDAAELAIIVENGDNILARRTIS